MRKQLLMKTFLVAVSLLMGTSAWADEQRTLVYSNNFETSSDWTANGKTDGWLVNPGNTTANTFNSKVIGNGSGTGDMGLCSPSFGLDAEVVKIVDVEMKFKMDACAQGKGSGIEFIQPTGVTLGNGWIASGTPLFRITGSATGNGYWGIAVNGEDKTAELNIASGTYENNNLNRNTTGIVVLNARFNFTSKEATYTMKRTDNTVLISSTTVPFGDENATSLDKIYIHAGKTYGGVTIDDIAIYSVTTSETYANYTINYKIDDNVVKTIAASNTVGATITALTAVDGEGTYEGKHYLITAAEAPSMTLVANAASNVLNVPVRVPYTATLNVTRNIGGVAQEPIETKLTETDARICAWTYTYPMYVQKDGVYYVADNVATFGESGTFTDGQVFNKTIAYTNPDYSVVYFGEPNESAGTNTAYSNGSTGYITGGVKYDNNSVIRLGTLPAGDYRLISNVTANAQRNVVVGDCSDTSVFPTALVTITAAGVKDETFTIAAATPVSISGKDQGSGKFNQSADIDYILVKASTQKAAIPTSGYGTIASAYALDCANLPAGLKAYQVTELTKETVTLEEVTEAVAAGTGLILKGTASETYAIPVAATGADISATNKLQAAVTATAVEADETYILQGGQFHKVTAASTIPAGKAYLRYADLSMARELTLTFGDATGIGATLKNKEIENKEVYNLKGQRVAQPTKGLYIQNGKKVIVK